MAQPTAQAPTVVGAVDSSNPSDAGANILRLRITAAAGVTQVPRIQLKVPEAILALDPGRPAQACSGQNAPCLAGRPAGWSVAVAPATQGSANNVVITLTNSPVGAFPPNGLVLVLPLARVTTQAPIQYFTGPAASASLTVQVDTAQGGGNVQFPPEDYVKLYACHGTAPIDNAFALALGDLVDITWSVTAGEWKALSGKLMGPLPGSLPQLDLTDSGSYLPAGGFFQVMLLADETYALEMTLQKADGSGPQFSVIRTLSLGVYEDKKYGALWLTPRRCLPHASMRANWAARDVLQADLELTALEGSAGWSNFGETVLSGTADAPAQGQGHTDFAAGTEGEALVSLTMSVKLPPPQPGQPQPQQPSPEQITVPVEAWQERNVDGLPASLPTALAYDQAGWLSFCTPDGIHGIFVDTIDTTPVPTRYSCWGGPTLARCLTMAGYPDAPGFVGLTVSQNGDASLAFLDVKAPERWGLELTDVALETFHGITQAQLVVAGNYIYVIGVVVAPHPQDYEPGVVIPAPLVCSRTTRQLVGPEPALWAARGARLVAVGDAVYALFQKTGELMRFEVGAGGHLQPPKAAASAVSKDGASLVTTGTPVAVEDLLVVIGSGQGDTPQDWVYDTRYNTWLQCGHGLDLSQGAVAYRGGSSRRLFAVVPDGSGAPTLKTLTALEYADMFAPMTVRTNAAVMLTEDYLNKTNYMMGAVEARSMALFARGEEALDSLPPVVAVPLTGQDRTMVNYRRGRTPNGLLGLETSTGWTWQYLDWDNYRYYPIQPAKILNLDIQAAGVDGDGVPQIQVTGLISPAPEDVQHQPDAVRQLVIPVVIIQDSTWVTSAVLTGGVGRINFNGMGSWIFRAPTWGGQVRYQLQVFYLGGGDAAERVVTY